MNKIAFIFPGQGSQYVGMGKSMCEKFAVAEETFKEANEILGFDLQTLCFRGQFEELSSPENLQPAILTASVAFYRVYQEIIGIEPDCFSGHSFGELSALVCAGALSFSDALVVARKKGEYAKKAVAGQETAMSAIENVAEGKVKKVCAKISQDKKIVEIGIINSAKQIIITGEAEAVARAESELKKQGAKIERLRTRAPFHSSLLSFAAVAAKKDLAKIKYKKCVKPVISSLTGQEYKTNEEIINNLSQSLCAPINWQKTISVLEKKGIDLAIEIGPQKVLTNLMPDISSTIEALTFNKLIDLEVLKKKFGLDKKNKTEMIIQCVKIAVCTKNNNWNNDEYEAGVVKPYQGVKNMLLTIEKDDLEPTLENVADALSMLDSVFQTKKTEKKEQTERYEEIFSDDCKRLRNFLKQDKGLKFL